MLRLLTGISSLLIPTLPIHSSAFFPKKNLSRAFPVLPVANTGFCVGPAGCYLLVCALSSVNHKGLHQGWPQTSLYLQVIHFTSHHTTSHVFLTYLYSTVTQHRNLHPAGCPILFCGPTQEPVLATANTGKTWERFLKKCSDWTRRVEISKEEIPGSKHSLFGYTRTYSRL